MKERPILMSSPMVRALLAGTKTQTRRVVKFKRGDAEHVWPQPDAVEPNDGYPGEWSPWINGERHTSILCPYGVPGDRLWVKETYSIQDVDGQWVYLAFKERMPPGKTLSETDGGLDNFEVTPEQAAWARARKDSERWRSSLFMPRWASRIALEITDVRVERLQDISQEDALAEGMPAQTGSFVHHVIADYRRLWESINGAGSWDANPWVWVLAFKRCS